MTKLRRFLADESGPTIVEYAVLIGCIILVCVASIALVGGGTYNFWNNNHTELDKAFTDAASS